MLMGPISSFWNTMIVPITTWECKLATIVSVMVMVSVIIINSVWLQWSLSFYHEHCIYLFYDDNAHHFVVMILVLSPVTITIIITGKLFANLFWIYLCRVESILESKRTWWLFGYSFSYFSSFLLNRQGHSFCWWY